MFRNRLIPTLPDWFMNVEAGDWALHILNAAHGNIGFLPEVMSAYRIHAAGTWSGRSVERRVVSIFELLTAVDHHFHGAYSAEIDRNRITTIRWLFGEWNNAAAASRRTVELLSIMTTGDMLRRCVSLGKGPAQSLQELERLAEQETDGQDYYSMVHKLETLLDEHTWLKEAHRKWTSSLTYKIAREFKRPWRQLRAKLREVKRHRIDLTDSPAPPTAKAA
jgi:hypothetical protein